LPENLPDRGIAALVGRPDLNLSAFVVIRDLVGRRHYSAFSGGAAQESGGSACCGKNRCFRRLEPGDRYRRVRINIRLRHSLRHPGPPTGFLSAAILVNGLFGRGPICAHGYALVSLGSGRPEIHCPWAFWRGWNIGAGATSTGGAGPDSRYPAPFWPSPLEPNRARALFPQDQGEDLHVLVLNGKSTGKKGFGKVPATAEHPVGPGKGEVRGAIPQCEGKGGGRQGGGLGEPGGVKKTFWGLTV